MMRSHRGDGDVTSVSPTKDLLPGLVALAVAAGFAVVMAGANPPSGAPAHFSVVIVAVASILAVAAPGAGYLVVRRWSTTCASLGVLALATICVALIGVYFYRVTPLLLFPADILIWSESGFVNDILKFRIGHPIYTAPEDNESFIYVPGAQLTTYLLAWLVGLGTSIPAFRVIQLLYAFLASVVAVVCCRRLLVIGSPDRSAGDRRLWAALSLPLLFLVATNPVTSPFVSSLHNDALAQLVSVLAYFILLEYSMTRRRWALTAMAAMPALGFFVKQSLLIWLPLYTMYLLVFDRPRPVGRVLVVSVGGACGLAAVAAGSYLVWGAPFIYWTFTVLVQHAVSPLRSIHHALTVWPFFVVGLLGGLWLLRGAHVRRLMGLWSIWLLLFVTELYTSGAAWMLNHAGPGSLIGTIWFVAGMVRAWPTLIASSPSFVPGRRWLRTALVVAMISLLFSGLGFFRIPTSAIPRDAYRYVSDIEREFAGQDHQRVLLDIGTWVYLERNVVMKDRAPSIGERGYSGTADFSAMIRRLREGQYDKILVRNFHSPDFWYDHYLWHRSSEIRHALVAHYVQTGTIAAVRDAPGGGTSRYGFTEISVLVPRTGSAGALHRPTLILQDGEP